MLRGTPNRKQAVIGLNVAYFVVGVVLIFFWKGINMLALTFPDFFFNEGKSIFVILNPISYLISIVTFGIWVFAWVKAIKD